MASDFGSGLGGIIGGVMASSDIDAGKAAVSGLGSQVTGMNQPYTDFGSSFLNPTSAALTGSGSNGTVGANRLAGTGNDVTSYEDFMKNYTASPGAQYATQQGLEAVNTSAAAKGGLLSGANLRNLNQTSQDISSTYANNAYSQYLAGNQQQFGQLETTLGNMFQGIGVGQTATGQNTSALTSEMGAQSSLAQAQAKADASTGSGIGSLFSGLTSMVGKK